VFVDGPDVLTWFDLHITVAPRPTANWLPIEDGQITRIPVTFDPRGHRRLTGAMARRSRPGWF